MLLMITLGTIYATTFQNVSAVGDEIVSSTIEINDNTANGPVLNNLDLFGSSIANIGDLNNDGVFDIAVGAYYDDAGGTNRGVIHVMFMNSNGTVSSTIEINNNTANGPVLNNLDLFGSSIANIGDLNNDGVFDIAVGAYYDDAGGTNRGVIHVMFMNSNGTVSSTIEINNNTANGPVLNNLDLFGSSIANIGDLNGDGISDIAVGATGDNGYTGAIHVMFMYSNGTVSDTIKINNNTKKGPLLSSGDQFGASIANIGDLNGDGTDDIAVGATSDDAGGSSRGAIHVLFMNSNGSVSGTREINDNTANGPVLNNLDLFGSSIANIGDLNNDGISDIAVGATGDDAGGSSRGAIYVLFMNSNGSVLYTIEINNNTANGPVLSDDDRFGSSIANIGDLNNDGIFDIAVGAYNDDDGGIDRGAIHVLFMNNTDLIPTIITVITTNATSSATLKVGDTISFTLTPGSTETGATITGTYNSQSLVWSTANNGTTYTATYTVSEGEPDQATPLQITNVTITDKLGNTSLPFNSTGILHTIDANSPQFASAKTLSASQIAITLDQSVVDSSAVPTDFTLGGVTGGSINSIVSVLNNIITLGITGATISDSDNVTISYTRTSGSFDDVSGNSLLNFAENVTNTLNTSPIIILNGANPQIIEQGAGYTELNATTNDDSPVTINSANFTDAVGTYYIYYDSTDTAGNNAIQVNRTVIVSDTTPPVISLIGENPQTIERGAGYTELNATTNDGSPVTIDSANFTDAVGTYYIYYDSTDTAGNNAIQVNRTVIVSDTTPPVISLIGENPQTIERGAGYTELNATTNDGSPVTIDSANFTDAVGTYYIYYDSTDTAGNNAIQVNRTVIVSDTTPPVISLIGENPQTIERGAGYTELNATTNDGSPVTINSANFTDAVGTYYIYYDSTDTAGNNAIQVNRTVIVSDTTPPVISLIGENPQTIERGAGYTELNATTNDGSPVTINSANFTDAVGTYYIYYDSTDTAGNNAIQVNRTVNVVDTTPPTFSSAILNEGTGIFTVTFSETINASAINAAGFSIRDINIGTGAVTLSTLELTTTVNGTTISFNMTQTNRQSVIAFTTSVLDIGAGAVQDIYGNAITLSVNNIITATLDTIPPVISLLGDNPQTIELGDGYTELNATTNDDSTITINSANFTDAVGTYYIYYDSTDTAGNNAIQVVRTVIVSDSTPLIITLNGNNPQTIQFGDGYTELGATTNDGSPVTINSAEFIDVVGTYHIYYDSTDAAGNSAIQVVRTVIVSDTTPPVITLNGNNPQTIEFGDGYTELNATTNDGSPVTINSAEFIDVVGTYHIYYDSTDAAGNSAIQVVRTVIVSDSTPPIITLNGNNPQTIDLGVGYTELGATTNDGSPVTINSAEFIDVVGTYHIYYDSTDAAGNSAIQVVRTVIVFDSTPPIITLNGNNPQTIEFGDGYTELGATTNDGSPVTINSAEFIDVVGTYHIYYDSTDTAGNSAIQVVRTVIVFDTTPPVISLIGDNPQTIDLGVGYTELGATTNDGSPVTIISTEFIDVVGTYHIYYDSTDTAGNSAIQAVRTVNVVDTTPPTFSSAILNEGTGIFTITFSKIINASAINAAGFSIRDSNTNTEGVTLSAPELTTTSNDTTVSFNMALAKLVSIIAFTTSVLDIDAGAVRDIFGNVITMSADNTITTTSDTTPPVISLNGAGQLRINLGAGYTELGATTSDGSLVTINAAEFTDAVGTYYIYYDSIDASGNSAIQAVRTVNVVDTTPPTFSSAILNEGTGIFTITFSKIINASAINAAGFSIRDSNTNTEGVTLSAPELTTTSNDTTVSFNMALAKLVSIIAFTTSVLDIDAGAVRDIFGNVITMSADNTITTTSDTTPPVISLNGAGQLRINLGAGYTELGATTSDGSLVTINAAEFTDAVGTYYIYYDSIDASGNSAIQAVRTVNVVDTTPPTFSSAILNEGTGIFTITFSKIINASAINAAGFSIRDSNTNTEGVTLSAPELTTTSNDTTVSFNMALVKLVSIIAFTTSVLDIDAGAVRDIFGNVITMSADNTITTTSDTTPPVISLIGDNPQTIDLGVGYAELGATTNDGSPVTINITEFTDAVGTYYIYYDSIDISGNSAIQVVRTVIVSDNTPPDPCVIPDSGDWIITDSCTLDASAAAPGSVIVQNDSVLNIQSGITLDIDFTTFNLTVQFGGGVLIKSGGTLN